MTYLPPEGSKFATQEMWDELQNEFSCLKSLSENVILMGDFNARTGRLNDFVQFDSFLAHETGMDEYSVSEIEYQIYIEYQII